MRAWGFLAILLLSACQREPDFDERFDKASEEIRAKADAMDADLERQAAKARAAKSEKAPTERSDQPVGSE